MRPDRIAATDRLAAWCAEHAERLDPLRFRFLEALARRTEAQQGKARELLEQKLSALLDAYAAALAAAPQSAGDADAAVRAMQPGPLGALLAQSRHAAVAIRAGNDHGANLEANSEASTATAPIDTELPAPSPLPTAATAAARLTAPQLPAVEDARRLWTELRSRSQLRQSLQPAPADAGPLNSGVLVHRALALMRTLSPGYLQHFLSYVDALSWLQQLHDGGALAKPQQPGSAAGKPTTPRSKPRKRG
ncbi:DUF2894 domain-containing protein [Xanthomonas sontii]|uniref:DUF2894 domain-containing protein n=1 Tax=Xanthomonas sontii TaxID=2650745 RepID=UPI0011E46FCB|nr:DUF2894 domain-containing protein [Xanthomonas sontii]MDQ7760055.1 DUF2894 domain-containing protein [Xanthomonas sontii]TYD33066.1 hypothetical protein CEK63_16185 [Xanthomonas sontii]UZK06214.1 DUF2894 domain-containing protein [Xanthomonas sontii]